jgi:ribosome-binding factor A
MTNRILKLEKRIGQLISEWAVLHAPEFPELTVITLQRISLAKDLSFVKIHISSVKDTEKACETLNQQAHELRKLLSQKMNLKKVPKLAFAIDPIHMQWQKAQDVIDKHLGP